MRSNEKSPQRMARGLGLACVIALVLPIACGESGSDSNDGGPESQAGAETSGSAGTSGTAPTGGAGGRIYNESNGGSKHDAQRVV